MEPSLCPKIKSSPKFCCDHIRKVSVSEIPSPQAPEPQPLAPQPTRGLAEDAPEFIW